MRYLTDKHADTIGALDGLDQAGRAQALADAERVYNYVRRNENIDDDELRQYGERNELPPDRLNTALAVLTETGRLLAVNENTLGESPMNGLQSHGR